MFSLCPVVPMFHNNVGIILLPVNTERILMKFMGGHHENQQMN